jgi:ABC-type transport system involved in cytochrome bd biosynthesis fused ATPase/permease subunit
VNSAAPAGQLRAEDVSFAYHGAARAALRHVSLGVAPGGVVLITGASGCGKSTHKTTAVDVWGYMILAVLVVGALVLNHFGIGARYYG